MSSGMNTEQAKEYAKTMTYSQAVSNIKNGKGIKYRKATMIKLRELAEIADRLELADVSWMENERVIEMALNDCKTKHNRCENCGTKCMWRDEPQTERSRQ